MIYLEQKIVKRITTAGVLLLVSGCSNVGIKETSSGIISNTKNTVVTGHEKQWASTPASLLTQGEVVNGNWWKEFKDPQLNKVIDQSVGRNYQVWQAKSKVAQARAQAAIIGAGKLPSVTAGTSPSYLKQRTGSSSTTTTKSYGLDLAVSWEIDLWKRLNNQSQSARELYLGSNDVLRSVRQTIAAQTAKAYFATVEAKQQVALSKATLAVLTETSRQVGNRADVGITSPSDKHLSIANKESASAGLAGQEESLARTSRQLQLLTSDYPDGKVQTANSLVSLPALPKLGIPASLLSRRPDVLAAERQLRASGFTVAAAKKALLPSFSLSTGLGTVSSELSNILSGDFSYWSLAGSLLQPIFQGGKLRANVQLSEGLQQEAASAYTGTVLTALTEVESALAARELINRRQAALCSAASASKDAERVSLNRYRQGIEPYLTVLESQQRALSASSSCISARYDALENYIDLQLALGGGFDERVESPATKSNAPIVVQGK